MVGEPFPCAYIKIGMTVFKPVMLIQRDMINACPVPLQSWGNGFNYSIWYVELLGQTDESVVAEALSSYSAVCIIYLMS